MPGALIVQAQPAFHLARHVPTGVVPDDNHQLFTLQRLSRHNPAQKLNGLIAVGTPQAAIEVELSRVVAFDAVVAEGFVRRLRQYHVLL